MIKKALLLVVTLLPSVGLRAQHPDLLLSSTTALVDERLHITVSNLEPGQTILIRATTLDQRQRPWTAEATFVSGPDGALDLATQAPRSGSYEAADVMGLFWSAVPDVEGAALAHRPGVDYVTTFELVHKGEVVDQDTLLRRFDAAGLTQEAVNDGPVVGAFYRPAGAGPFPAVVVFAGSDGGLSSAAWRAALLASRGFAALAVAYFRYEGRPDDLVEIPLEDAAAAVDWIKEREGMARVGVIGFSKGSELALSLAARDRDVSAVVAISPSAYVWPGLSDGPPEKRSSWSWQGEPLPPVPWTVGPKAGQMFGQGSPFRLRLLYEESLQAAPEETLNAAAIPVDNIDAPVLLVSGGDDGSWPASDMSRAIVARMKSAEREVTHLDYPGAGHLLFWDYLPATVSTNPGQIFGGSAAATAAARADSWPTIQHFLQTALARDQ